MAIGIDVDEVIFPLAEPLCIYLNRKHGINLELNQFKSYNFWENPHYKILGVQATKQQAIDDFHEYSETEEFKSIQPYPLARDWILELRGIDRLVAITSRQNKIQEDTMFNLGHYFPRLFEKARFGNHLSKDGKPEFSKLEMCREEKVRLMIEDNSFYAKQLSQYIPVILIDKPWNQDLPIDAPNIYRVKEGLDASIIAKALLKRNL